MLARQDRQSVEFGGLGTDLCQQVLNAGESVVVGVGHYRRRIAAFARRALSQIDTGFSSRLKDLVNKRHRD